jgi:glycosyltransferase involved in cell wall biosynthesis
VHTFHALGIVKHRHLGPADTSPPERLDEEQRLVGVLDHIVATCSDELFELRRLGADPSRLTVVPCGVDLDRFSATGPARPRSGRPRIAVVGRLVERKGVETVVRALVHLPRAELVIAGGPPADRLPEEPEVARLLELADELGVTRRVQFTGRATREEVAALLRSADVVACVPWYEPFGIVPLEAMACGTPVVASAVGGLIDTVVHGVTGLHVPPRAPEALAEALAAVLDDPALAAALGAAGADRARRRYGWSTIARATAEVYRTVARPGAVAEVGTR